MGSLMWHDPEMSFVLIHATMLKEGNLHMSLVREALGFFFFFVPSSSPYFLITNANVIAGFLLNARTF